MSTEVNWGVCSIILKIYFIGQARWLKPVIPALWEAEAGGSWGQEIETILVNMVETPSLLKIQKISWAWWRVPVIPATREAEAGELPEPRRRRLWWAEIAPLHSSLGNKSETLSQKKLIIIIKGIIVVLGIHRVLVPGFLWIAKSEVTQLPYIKCHSMYVYNLCFNSSLDYL